MPNLNVTSYLPSVQLICLKGLLFSEGKQKVDWVQGRGNEGKYGGVEGGEP